MQQFYISLAKIQKRRMRKLVEERTVVDYDLTEKTLMANCESVFGKGSRILGMLIYVLGSNSIEHKHFDFVSFIKILLGLYNDNKVERNKTIFRLLDLEKKNVLNIIILL
jgi:hypothetical protein